MYNVNVCTFDMHCTYMYMYIVYIWIYSVQILCICTPYVFLHSALLCAAFFRDYAVSKSLYTPSVFSHNDMCLAEFFEDELWYRGVVEDLKDVCTMYMCITNVQMCVCMCVCVY